MRRGGFTLLEVMVAVAILGMSLVAIFSSQVGAAKVTYRAQSYSIATLLARCKMGEIEEHVLREGFPAVEDAETDECCEDAGTEGFECDWRLERVVLPEETPEGEGEEGAAEEGGEGGAGGLPSSLASVDPNSLKDGAGLDAVLGGMGGGDDMIASLAMSYAYPILKPLIEEEIRRATVTVRWKEGTRTQSFDVVQYLVRKEQSAP